jgi:hypothetical protein
MNPFVAIAVIVFDPAAGVFGVTGTGFAVLLASALPDGEALLAAQPPNASR